ncbi:uncharacterized protein [Triticum aestivum]|uniref:uncharacterized protein n=1 Tax=Triticum aestivum TaxID=4565 RepID=UPI001D019893|nr:uncharacterized protein LOC123040536 [Triticum aestivum]
MGELGSWASDDELVKMEAGYLPHRCRDDSFEDSETSELLISKLSSLVGEIYRDLPENLQKKLGDEVRRATEQPADNSGQAKGWMWGARVSKKNQLSARQLQVQQKRTFFFVGGLKKS